MIWDNTDLCTFQDFKGRLRSLGYLLQSDKTEKELFNDYYDIVKADIKKRLHIKFKKKYENTPKEWAERARRKAETAARDRRWGWYGDTSARAQYAYITASGEWVEIVDLGIDETPILFLNNTVPTSTTYANTCQPGDFLIDTTRNGFLYINRGTSAVPDWQRWSYKDLTDYIIDGENALKESCIAGLLFYMVRYLFVPQNAGSLDDSPELDNLKKSLFDDYNIEFAKEYDILEVDSDGDTVLSNFDLEMQTSENEFGPLGPN